MLRATWCDMPVDSAPVEANDRPRISLVLATVGRCQELQPLLQSLTQQTEPRFELIVVDQNVDDRLLPWVHAAQAQGLWVRHLRHQPPNLAAARNRGLAAAAGDVVAFPDDDACYEADTLQRALAGLATRPEDDGLIGWWVDVLPQGPDRQGLADLAEWSRLRGGVAASITLFLRTEAVRRWGGFDARLGVGQWYGSGEETDLLLCGLKAGGRLRHDAAVRVRHAAPSVAGQRWGSTLRRARGTGAVMAKNRLPAAVVLRACVAPVAALVLGRVGLVTAGARVAGVLQGWVGWRMGWRAGQAR